LKLLTATVEETDHRTASVLTPPRTHLNHPTIVVLVLADVDHLSSRAPIYAGHERSDAGYRQIVRRTPGTLKSSQLEKRALGLS
jgi:hypothetical protein